MYDIYKSDITILIMNKQNNRSEKYQWAIYLRGLSRDKLEALIPAMEFNIENGIEVARSKGRLAYIKELLGGM